MDTIHDSRVPYERMTAEIRKARERFPDAARIEAFWTPANGHDITLEVWGSDGRARTGALA